MASKIDYELNDSKLVYLVNENNEDAKDYLFHKYNPLIHKEINRVKKIAHDAGIDMADLSQEAMLAFSNAINSYNDDEVTKFITFATICIRRKLSNYIKKHLTSKSSIEKYALALECVNEYQVTLLDNLKDSDSKEPLNRLITEETLDEMNRRLVEKLSDNEKYALLYSLDGKTINEISELLGLTSKQVYNLLHRARTKLKSD